MIRSDIQSRLRRQRGLTLVEIMIVLSIIVILAVIAVPIYWSAVESARPTAAVQGIRVLQIEIDIFWPREGRLPTDLDELGWGRLDPWGNPYQYVPFAALPEGGDDDDDDDDDVVEVPEVGFDGWREDRFNLPINSLYDLYSMGKDGVSEKSITAVSSRDDIIRADDGAFVGRASRYRAQAP